VLAARRVASGEAFDFVVLASDAIERLATSTHPAASQSFLSFLTSPESRSTRRRFGMEPG
jgi:ABC-type molybdate transport system substrate-binding protein